MALIELDRTTPADPPRRSRPPARRYRLAGLIVAAGLVLALGGAAPAGSLLWRYLGFVPVSVAVYGPEAPFQLAGGRVYTVLGDGTDRVVDAWTPGVPLRKLWTARFPARVTGPDQVAFGGVGVRSAGGVVLLADGPSTTAVDARTGRTRWTSPVAVQPLAGDRIGLTQNERYPAGSLYDQDSGDPGTLYFSSTGEPHTEAPISTEVRGVDLATGATVWSVPVGGAINVFTGADVTVLSSDRLTTYAGSTGTVLRTTPLPQVNGIGPATGELDGDTLLVDYGGPGSERRTLVAYRAGTLERRWSRPEPADIVDPSSCAGVLCASDDGHVAVLDPATGRPLWRVPGGVDLERRGDAVLESRADPSRPYRLVDPATGDPRTDLAAWNGDLSTSADQPIVLRHDQAAGGNSFGVVLPGRSVVQGLGLSRSATSGCVADDRYVVCRAGDDEGLRIWAYRAGPVPDRRPGAQ